MENHQKNRSNAKKRTHMKAKGTRRQTRLSESAFDKVPLDISKLFLDSKNKPDVSASALKVMLWKYINIILQSFAENSFRPLKFEQIFQYVSIQIGQPHAVIAPYLVIALSLAKKFRVITVQRNLFRLDPTKLVPSMRRGWGNKEEAQLSMFGGRPKTTEPPSIEDIFSSSDSNISM